MILARLRCTPPRDTASPSSWSVVTAVLFVTRFLVSYRGSLFAPFCGPIRVFQDAKRQVRAHDTRPHNTRAATIRIAGLMTQCWGLKKSIFRDATRRSRPHDTHAAMIHGDHAPPVVCGYCGPMRGPKPKRNVVLYTRGYDERTHDTASPSTPVVCGYRGPL